FIIMALAAQATSRVSLATAVAVAFPRSPTITAHSAWTLQRLSHGRFTLGLGSQVKGHIERRYGMRWSPPGPWLRDYVGALRAIWAGRDFAGFTMCVMPLVATAPDRAGLAERIRDVRARVAFYASTPTYLAAFETDGYGETAKQLVTLGRAQRWEEMPQLVDDT